MLSVQVLSCIKLHRYCRDGVGPGSDLAKDQGLSYTHLYVTSGILRRYGNSVLGSNDSNLGQDGIADSPFDLLNLLDGLLLVQAIEEEIDV